MRRFLCWLGWHSWVNYGAGQCLTDPFPVEIRICEVCGKRQRRGWGNKGPWEDAGLRNGAGR